MTREKVSLTGEKETLLITVFGKAGESLLPDSLLHDHYAAAVVRQIDYDFSKLKISRDIMIGLAMRAKILDDWTRAFINKHPRATVLHLGCGLDSRVFRVDPPGTVNWFDLDYPEVIELRDKVYPARDSNYIMIPSNVADLSWLAAVPKDQPAVIIAEGLMPYLHESTVLALLNQLTEHFPSGEIAFDAYNKLSLRLFKLSPSIRATGASIHWGIDDLQELKNRVPKLHLLEQVVLYDSPQVKRMSPAARLFILFFWKLPALRNIGRMLHYRF